MLRIDIDVELNKNHNTELIENVNNVSVSYQVKIFFSDIHVFGEPMSTII